MKLEAVLNLTSQLEQAEEYVRQGNLEEAISLYQKLINLNHSNGFIYNKLAQTEAQAQKWTEAIANYQKALELDRGNPFWIYRNLGDALREVGKLKEAIKNYQQAIDRDPQKPEAYDSLGQAQSLTGDYVNAISSYQKAIDLGIANPFWTYQNLGDALNNENRLDEAQAAYRQAQEIKAKANGSKSETEVSTNSHWLEIHNRGDEYFVAEDWLQAIASYQEAIELNPHYFWSHYNLARALTHVARWDEAIVCYEQAIKIDPQRQQEVDQELQIALDRAAKSHKLNSDREILESLNQAKTYFQQQQWQRAIPLYQQVINAKPDIGKSVYHQLGTALIAQQASETKTATKDNSSAKNKAEAEKYHKIADGYYQKHQLEEAKVYYQKAIEADPSFAVSFRALGDIYKQKNDFAKAEEYYSKSVELKPNYSHAYQRLAFVLQQQGKLPEAIAAYRSCLKIKPNDTQLKEKLNQLLAEIGETDLVAKAAPMSTDEYYALGEALYQQGELDSALTAHQQAIALNPNLPLSFRAMGDIFVRTRKPAEAIAAYRRALELKPDYYYGYQKLGNVLQNQGEIQEAIATYRRALEIRPYQSDVQQKLEKLLQAENMLPPMEKYDPKDYPRVLVVAPIKFNQQAGGGVTMGNYFRGWPQEAIAQVHSDTFTEADYTVCSQYFYLPSRSKTASPQIPLKTELLKWCRDFKPDVIFARPVDHPQFYWWLPQALSQELNVPYVTNVMDDWPARYAAKTDLPRDDASKALLKQSLQQMFDGAAANIAISPQMCAAYQQRYNNQFVPFHNCINVAEWSKIAKSYEVEGEFSLLYLGVVTEDKELGSLKDVRDTVLALHKQGYKINLQIYSAPFCQSTIEKHLTYDSVVEYAGYVHPSKLPQILSEADLLVLPINFDAASLKYVGYSIQTKVPEYMASGTPILAYGPSVSPNISYATKENWGLVVDKPDKNLLREAIISVMKDDSLRSQLGKYARNLAFRNHDAKVIRENYRQLIVSAAFSNCSSISQAL